MGNKVMPLMSGRAGTVMKDDGEMTAYLDEVVKVEVTRRQLYWLREMNKRRLSAALQGQQEIRSSPAKRAMRREEYRFHAELRDRLYGMEPDQEEWSTDDTRSLLESVRAQLERTKNLIKELDSM